MSVVTHNWNIIFTPTSFTRAGLDYSPGSRLHALLPLLDGADITTLDLYFTQSLVGKPSHNVPASTIHNSLIQGYNTSPLSL